jgi:hypothetical protein
MAQALSIVGEGGVDGIEYNAIIGLVAENSEPKSSKEFQSNKMRVSLRDAHRFSAREFEEHM